MEGTALFVCDLQESFRSRIPDFSGVVEATRIMIEACTHLGVRAVVVSEQYPVGLGRTVHEIVDAADSAESGAVLVVPKTSFSMCGVPAVMEHARRRVGKLKHVILCGIEAHACIYQTARDLIAQGLLVTILVDAVASQRDTERAVAFSQLSSVGCKLSTVEMSLLEMVRRFFVCVTRYVRRLYSALTKYAWGLSGNDSTCAAEDRLPDRSHHLHQKGWRQQSRGLQRAQQYSQGTGLEPLIPGCRTACALNSACTTRRQVTRSRFSIRA